MPSILDDSTVQAIAREFCSNKRNKTRAMIAIGYDEAYANSGKGHKTVYENIRVKEAIKAIDEVSAGEAGRTQAQLDDMYVKAYALANQCNQPAAMNGAVTGIARLYGMDKDNQTRDADTPDPITNEDLAILKSMAKSQTHKELSVIKIRETA